MEKSINTEVNKPKDKLKGFPVLTSEDLKIVLLALFNTIFWCWLYYWAIINVTKIILGIAVKIYS